MDQTAAAAGPAGHRLAKLLAPQSVALVGASPKPDTVGNGMIRGLLGGGFKGRVYPVNPNYPDIEGMRCYPSLAALPERVDHALLGVANARLEAAMREAASAGVAAVTILASGYLETDAVPPLPHRLPSSLAAPACKSAAATAWASTITRRACAYAAFLRRIGWEADP